MFQSAIQVMHHTVLCDIHSFPYSNFFVLFFFLFFSGLSLYEDGEPPFSMQSVSKARSLAWVDRFSSESCQMGEQFSFPLPPVYVRLHWAELKFIATYQKFQGGIICPLVSTLCMYKDTIVGEVHRTDIKETLQHSPQLPSLSTHINKF